MQYLCSISTLSDAHKHNKVYARCLVCNCTEIIICMRASFVYFEYCQFSWVQHERSVHVHCMWDV